MVSDSELKVVVLGLGYIGLPTAAVIARTGASVLGVDVTPSVVDTVNSGRVHIEEVDLDGLVSAAELDLRKDEILAYVAVNYRLTVGSDREKLGGVELVAVVPRLEVGAEVLGERLVRRAFPEILHADDLVSFSLEHLLHGDQCIDRTGY